MAPAPGRRCRRRRGAAGRRGQGRGDAGRGPRPDRAGLAGRAQRPVQPRHVHRCRAPGGRRRLSAPLRGAGPARPARPARSPHRPGAAGDHRRRRPQSVRLPRGGARARARAAGDLAARRRTGRVREDRDRHQADRRVAVSARARRAGRRRGGRCRGRGTRTGRRLRRRRTDRESGVGVRPRPVRGHDRSGRGRGRARRGARRGPRRAAPGGDTRRSTTVLAQLLGPFRAVHGRFPSVPELRQLLDGAPGPLAALRKGLADSGQESLLRELDARERQMGNPGDVGGSSRTGSRCSTGPRSPRSSRARAPTRPGSRGRSR